MTERDFRKEFEDKPKKWVNTSPAYGVESCGDYWETPRTFISYDWVEKLLTAYEQEKARAYIWERIARNNLSKDQLDEILRYAPPWAV